MKKIVFISAICAWFLFSGNVVAQKNYGATIEEAGAISMGDLNAKMKGQTELKVKVQGKVTSVCQAKGCWMMLENPDGTTMRVTFTDYGFFVPKDISGKTVVVSGRAYYDVTSVEELRHYAHDAGKSKEEIEKITEGKRELAFEADGVIVK